MPQPEIIQGLVIVNAPQNARVEGMGLDFYANNSAFRRTVDEISETLQESPKQVLSPDRTISPFVFSMGAYHALVDRYKVAAETLLGFSLGENASLVQANTIDLSVMSQILKAREDALNLPIKNTRKQFMVALGGREGDLVDYIQGKLATFSFSENIEIANINSPNQLVLAVEADLTQEIEIMSSLKNLFPRPMLIKKLNNMTAIHSTFLKPQEKIFQHQIEPILALDPLKTPPIDDQIYSAILKTWINEKSQIKDLICHQITHTVDFRRAWQVLTQADRVGLVLTLDPTFVPRSLTEKLVNSNLPEARVINISKPVDLDCLII